MLPSKKKTKCLKEDIPKNKIQEIKMEVSNLASEPIQNFAQKVYDKILVNSKESNCKQTDKSMAPAVLTHKYQDSKNVQTNHQIRDFKHNDNINESKTKQISLSKRKIKDTSIQKRQSDSKIYKETNDMRKNFKDSKGLKSPAKSKFITKTNKYKQIKLVINITSKKKMKKSSEVTNPENGENENNASSNIDLSFLDDFNIDEIVASLNCYEQDTDTSKRNIKEIVDSNIDQFMLSKKDNKTHNPVEIRTELDQRKINNMNNITNIETRTTHGVKQLENCMEIEISTQSFPLQEETKNTSNCGKLLSLDQMLNNKSYNEVSTRKSEIKDKNIVECEEITNKKSFSNTTLTKDEKNVKDAKLVEDKNNSPTITILNRENIDDISKINHVNYSNRNNSKDGVSNIDNNTSGTSLNFVQDFVENKIETPTEDRNLEDSSSISNKPGNETTSKTPDMKNLNDILDKIIVTKLEMKMQNMFNLQYNAFSIIHKGRYSRILRCNDSKNQKYAVKVLNNESESYFRGLEKNKMLLKLQDGIPESNLNSIYLFNSFMMEGYWCFLMEYFPNNLKQALIQNGKSFHIDVVQNLARQLVSAVTLLRNANIIHSDIKPNHLLLNCSNDKLKLCGFDTSYYVKEVNLRPNIGTVSYRAPEVILGHSASYSIDVWATAVVLYEMGTNRKLFPGIYNNEILYKQMCMLGNIPIDMIQNSLFAKYHFHRDTFKRRFGLYGKNVSLVTNFVKKVSLYESLLTTYNQDWIKIRTEEEKDGDMIKLRMFYKLLTQMLVLHPNHRLPIEFVYVNPFLYLSY